VWIPLTYPDKETELKIIRMNCEPATLDENTLNKIYVVVKAMRDSKDLEIPASVRAGISIAKLVANYVFQHGEVDNEIFVNYAVSVLLGASKAREWMLEKGRIEQLVRDNLTHA
jgi:hypothetical protein